jgi:hypothetical protein
MKRTKTLAQAFPGIALIAVIAVFFLFAGITGCNPCPAGSHCQPDIPGGGSTPIAIGGTVLERTPPGNVASNAGDSVYYLNGANALMETTVAGGTFGPDYSAWDNTNPMYHYSFKHGFSVDAIIYNKLGAPPYTDLTNDQFNDTLVADGGTIPLTVIAQNANRVGYNGALVQLKDASFNNVGTAVHTNSSGVCTYGTQLNQGTVYWVWVSGPGPNTAHIQFNTAVPLDVMPGTMSALRVYARY